MQTILTIYLIKSNFEKLQKHYAKLHKEHVKTERKLKTAKFEMS